MKRQTHSRMNHETYRNRVVEKKIHEMDSVQWMCWNSFRSISLFLSNVIFHVMQNIRTKKKKLCVYVRTISEHNQHRTWFTQICTEQPYLYSDSMLLRVIQFISEQLTKITYPKFSKALSWMVESGSKSVLLFNIVYFVIKCNWFSDFIYSTLLLLYISPAIIFFHQILKLTLKPT